jgi:hypothetical protein
MAKTAGNLTDLAANTASNGVGAPGGTSGPPAGTPDRSRASHGFVTVFGVIPQVPESRNVLSLGLEIAVVKRLRGIMKLPAGKRKGKQAAVI